MNNLKGKRILFLSVRLFSYEIFIANGLRELGAQVDYYDERPANSIFAKGIIRLKRSLYKNKIESYYKNILKETNNKSYDYLFVMKGEVIPEFFLETFKKRYPQCLFLFYTWDSFANNVHPVNIQKYFDKAFTFDSNDAKKHHMYFRPLFFINDYEKIKDLDKKEFKYNLLFLGTAHTDRYRISTEAVKWCDLNNLTSYAYYYMQGRMVFLFKKFFDESFKKFDYKKLSFNSLSTTDTINLYKNSQVILDINHPAQSGLTMRTFETLGAGKKLITTNNNIKNYPFYNPNNILIVDRENPQISIDFFRTPFSAIDPDLLYNMSIEGWLNCIFVEPKPNYWLQGHK